MILSLMIQIDILQTKLKGNKLLNLKKVTKTYILQK